MLKRLLIAVFVLGLVMAFSGTAIAADINHGPLNKVMKIDPTNPRLNNLDKAGPEQPATRKPASAMQKLPVVDAISAPSPIPVYFCDLQDYTSGGAAYFWTIPDAYGDDLFNTRFTSDAGMDCSLKVADYLMYWPPTVGTPDMRCYLWDDDGFGFPGTKLDSVDIPWAVYDAAHTAAGSNLFFVSADFSAGNWVFSDGEEYHLGWTVVGGGPGATLAILSDAADGPFVGEERSSEYWGMWGSMLNDWGLDASFFIYAERCCSTIPFTDCYSELQMQNLTYLWRAPHPTYGDEAYSQRFDVMGPDTLVSVDFACYDDGSGLIGNDDIMMTIWGDDGSGLPDPLNQVAQVTLLAGTYPLFPSLATANFNMSLTAGTYHAAFSSSAVFGSGDYEATLSSDGTDGVGGSASDWGGGTWVSMLNGWGGDYNFYYIINICKDEFSICFAQNTSVGLAWFWRLPDAYGDTHDAQMMSTTGEGCRVQDVSWALYNNGDPGLYDPAYDVVVEIYNDVAGLPGGAPVASIATNQAAAVQFPGMHTVDFTPQNVIVTSTYWIAITTTSPAEATGIQTLTDGGGSGANLQSAEMWNGMWEALGPAWGTPDDVAFVAESEVCCIPFSEYSCAPGATNDWATLQGDYGRTGRSEIALSDAWCDLSLNWRYDDPGGNVFFAAPTIYNGKVAMCFNDHLSVFDLALGGAPLYTLNTSAADSIGNQLRSAPTIQNVGGVDMMFFGGGSAGSVLAYNFNTGVMIWNRGVVGLGSLGTTRWLTPVIIDVAGTDVLIYGDDAAKVTALNAATGASIWGPISLTALPGASTFKAGATDGVNFFVGIYSPAGEGDIWSLDGATGTINWQLSSSGGLQGTAVFGAAYTDGEEGFTGVSYQNGTLFANSRLQGDHPTDGLFYRINSASGALIDGAASISNRGGSQFTGFNPVVDVNRIYSNTYTRWVGAPAGPATVVFNRANGAIDFNMAGPENGRFHSEGILTCEPGGADDLFISADEDGWLMVSNAETGAPIYRRRNNGCDGSSVFNGGAVATDPVSGEAHVVWADNFGRLYDFKKGVDRPRLQFETYSPAVPVEFGPAPSLVVDLGPFISNTGCADLNIGAVTVDDASTGVAIPGFVATIGGDLLQKSSSIANDLTINSNEKFIPKVDADELGADMMVTRGQEINPAASAFPSFLNAVVAPVSGQVLVPGEVVNLQLDVIQSAIQRGPQVFYITVSSDDPDFFINDVACVPEARITLVGGCLIDTTALDFGVGSSNMQFVTNNNRLGTGDWDPHGFLIDGDASSYYQGSYVYATSEHQISTSSQDWTSGGGEDDAFISSQADPNYCDTQCRPALSAGVGLGAMWDGSAYAPITGNMVCATYLDSVQNFDLGSGWDWTNFGAPFDNALTMGLTCNSRTVGAVDVPELANLTLEIMEYTERNGNAVPGWILGSYHDYDAGGDFGNYDGANSLGWSAGGAGAAWGQIKIPFGGCDGPGLINAHGLQGDMALWDWSAYWDSTWIQMNAAPGYYDHDMGGGDGEMAFTLAAHDFAPNETFTVGVANFGIEGLANNSSSAELIPMAKLVNQWAGFGRGNVDGVDGCVLSDILYLAAYVNNGGTGPVPFLHLGDVNIDGAVDNLDVIYLIDYYFNCGPCPGGDWVL